MAILLNFYFLGKGVETCPMRPQAFWALYVTIFCFLWETDGINRLLYCLIKWSMVLLFHRLMPAWSKGADHIISQIYIFKKCSLFRNHSYLFCMSLEINKEKSCSYRHEQHVQMSSVLTIFAGNRIISNGKIRILHWLFLWGITWLSPKHLTVESFQPCFYSHFR